MALEYALRLHAGDALELLAEGRPTTPHDAIVLQEVQGLDAGDITEEVDSLADVDGDWLGAATSRGRVLVLEGVITASSRTLLRARLTAMRRALAASRATWSLRVEGRAGDPETLELAVRVSGNGPLRASDDGTGAAMFLVPWQVALRSADASLAGVTVHTATVNPAATVGGFGYPYSYPYSYGGSTTPGADIGYLGDAREWPLVRLYGPISTPVLENLTTGQGVYIDGTIAAGDWLELDTRPNRRTVLANGVAGASRYGLVNPTASSWWALEPGPNVMRLRASDFGAGARAELVYRNRYM